jgi:hypothetical protein
MSQDIYLQLHLPDGRPDGIKVLSIGIRSVTLVEVPRDLMSDYFALDESRRIGVYFLFGADDEGRPVCYIGKTERTRGQRFTEHVRDAKKDYWTHALIAVPTHQAWNSTHVGLLESLSIRTAKEIGQYVIKNRSQPSVSTNPADETACKDYLSTIALLLTTLGYPLLTPIQHPLPGRPRAAGAVSDGEVVADTVPVRPQRTTPRVVPEPVDDDLFFRTSGCDARGRLTPSGFVVYAGSAGNVTPRGSVEASTIKFRNRLLESGVLREDGDRLVFVTDYVFKTPSGAGALLVGGPTNGKREWRDAHGCSINDRTR